MRLHRLLLGGVAVLAASAATHLQAGLPTVQSGDYMGEHWLATFAVQAMTQAAESR